MNLPVAGLAMAATQRPAVRRRLLCAVYELVLLVGVVMAASLLYSVLTQQRHALQGKLGLQLVIFVVLGGYFTWFWSHGGQTLAMKTWRLRLVMSTGEPLPMITSFSRYFLCWIPLWLSLLVAQMLNQTTRYGVAGWLAAGGLTYIALAAIRADGQLVHDVLCKTRVIDWPVADAQGASRQRAHNP